MPISARIRRIGVSPPSESTRDRCRFALSATGYRVVSWNQSGSELILAEEGPKSTQLVSIEKPGGLITTLTDSREPVLDPCVSTSPNNNGCLFVRDSDGSERFQITHLELANAKERLLSDGTGSDVSPLWAPSGLEKDRRAVIRLVNSLVTAKAR